MRRPISLPVQLPLFNDACLRELSELCAVFKSPEADKSPLAHQAHFPQGVSKEVSPLPSLKAQETRLFAHRKVADSSAVPFKLSGLAQARKTPVAVAMAATTRPSSKAKQFPMPLVGCSAVLLGVVAAVCFRLWVADGGHFLLAGRVQALPSIPASETGAPMALEAQPARLPFSSPFGTLNTEPPALVATAASTEGQEMPCSKFQGPIATFTSARAIQDGALINVVGAGGQFVCLKDSRGKVFHYAFASASGRSFYGTPPWLVESPNLGALQVYFQGVLVRLPQAENVRLRLIAGSNI